jgi:hypothetical protein
MDGDERLCPNDDCDGHLTSAQGMVWRSERGNMLPWVLTCITCYQRTGHEWTWGLDEDRILVGPVYAFMQDDDLSF